MNNRQAFHHAIDHRLNSLSASPERRARILRAAKGESHMKTRIHAGYKVAAVFVALFLGINAIALAVGSDNIYSMIYRYFVPDEGERINQVSVEGEKEDVEYVGVESSLGYTIQYDDSDYNLERIDDKDYYRVNNPGISETVYFVVYHMDAAYAELKSIEAEETTIGDRQAFMLESIDGKEYDVNAEYSWDSEVVDTWYINAGQGTYVVEIHCFMEAFEGWGAKMTQLLSSFKVVEP